MNEQNNEPEFDVEGHRIKAQGEAAAEDTEGHRHLAVDGADEDTEGHRYMATGDDEDTEGHKIRSGNLTDDDEDVEGHRLRHGANITEDDEDVEGHRFMGSNVQPPRDADLGGTSH